MSFTKQHAEREFDILLKSVKDPKDVPIIQEFKDEIIALCDKVGKSQQSGGSIEYVANIVSKTVKELCLFQVLSPLRGDEKEWLNCTYAESDMFQNNRLPSVFKHGKDGTPYYLDAIIFEDQHGSRFTSSEVKLKNGGTVTSRQYIKKFPFMPKTFLVEVISTEWADREETTEKEGGGWWSHEVKDEKQLKEVFKYYNKFVF